MSGNFIKRLNDHVSEVYLLIFLECAVRWHEEEQ